MAILDLQPTTDGAGGYAAPGESGDIAAGGAVVGIHGAEVSETLSGDTNNWDLGDAADALTWLVDFAGHTLTGILAPEVGGEWHVIRALTAGTIASESGSSAAANRITTPGGADITLPADGAVVIEYLATTSRWQVIAVALSSASVGAAGGMVPYYIAPAATFTVPLYKQALYSTEIDNEGTLEVIGLLLEVS